ncbi:MAG: HEPN domain-containing protein, partial [Bacteroidia bacterium]|nr:HEPN domain-containing protein [Bacteroidia bacterium]
NWLIKANEDIDVILQLSVDHPENYTSAISFHSQQSVEKFLKAYLVYKDIEFDRTHDVDFLLSECMSIEKNGFEELDLKNLNDYAVTVRYPDDFMIPSLKEALENKEIAIQVKQIIEGKIQIETL